MRGTVLAALANFYRVRLAEGDEVLCTRRALLKKTGQSVCVGDRVEVERTSERGVITAVEPRRNQLERPPIANVDQVLVVMALAEPTPDPVYLTRLLVAIATQGLHAHICLSKADLEDAQPWVRRLAAWGYASTVLSSHAGLGLTAMHTLCRDRISVVAGASGAGKSSLLNALIPSLSLQTQPVSGRLQQGRHTTRHVELYPLPSGGWLADTPGFNQIDLSRCTVADLLQAFPEAQSQEAACAFSNCLHLDEPDCAVRSRSWERYPLYCELVRELQAQADYRKSDIGVKQTGNRQAPRLHGKYRTASRRSQQQHDWEYEES